MIMKLRLNESDMRLLDEYFNDLSIRTQLLKSDEFIQHGNTSCLLHSIAVCYYSLLFAERLNIRCDKKSLVVGALLHDYFLYDWHEKDSSHRLHGFFHPGKAYHNACRDYDIGEKEGDIIKHHMFPLTITPPKCREGVIVCIVDKCCSGYETFKSYPYKRLYDEYIGKNKLCM